MGLFQSSARETEIRLSETQWKVPAFPCLSLLVQNNESQGITGYDLYCMLWFLLSYTKFLTEMFLFLHLSG